MFFWFLFLRIKNSFKKHKPNKSFDFHFFLKNMKNIKNTKLKK